MSKKEVEFSSSVEKPAEKIFLTEKNLDEITINPENEEAVLIAAHKNWTIQALAQSEEHSQVVKDGIRHEKISLTAPTRESRSKVIQDIAWGRINNKSLSKALAYISEHNAECDGDPKAGYKVMQHGLLELKSEVEDTFGPEVLDILRESSIEQGVAHSKHIEKPKSKASLKVETELAPKQAAQKRFGARALQNAIMRIGGRREKEKTDKKEKSILKEIDLYKVSQKTRKDALNNLIIEGDDNYFPEGLNQKIVERCNLAPEYKTRIENTDVLLSKTFDLGHGRAAVLGYVKQDHDNLYRISTYYRSNSQGLWRLLPDYDDSIYGKGWRGLSEDSLNLPIELQCALHKLANPAPEQGYSSTKYKVALSTTKYIHGVYGMPEEKRPPYYREISSKPLVSYGSIVGQSRPEELQIQGDEAPDFTNEYLSYDTRLPLYGDSHIDCYWSKNKERKYVFIKDHQKQAALLNIETTAPLSSTGLRSEWVEMGRFGTPLYEYFGQGESMTVLAGTQNEQHPEFPEYGSTFKEYLSKVPIIQDYLAASETK